jgi:hypothetical protein
VKAETFVRGMLPSNVVNPVSGGWAGWVVEASLSSVPTVCFSFENLSERNLNQISTDRKKGERYLRYDYVVRRDTRLKKPAGEAGRKRAAELVLDLSRESCLIIGSTESIGGLCPEFEPKRYLRSVFYHFKNSA